MKKTKKESKKVIKMPWLLENHVLSKVRPIANGEIKNRNTKIAGENERSEEGVLPLFHGHL